MVGEGVAREDVRSKKGRGEGSLMSLLRVLVYTVQGSVPRTSYVDAWAYAFKSFDV